MAVAGAENIGGLLAAAANNEEAIDALAAGFCDLWDSFFQRSIKPGAVESTLRAAFSAGYRIAHGQQAQSLKAAVASLVRNSPGIQDAILDSFSWSVERALIRAGKADNKQQAAETARSAPAAAHNQKNNVLKTLKSALETMVDVSLVSRFSLLRRLRLEILDSSGVIEGVARAAQGLRIVTSFRIPVVEGLAMDPDFLQRVAYAVAVSIAEPLDSGMADEAPPCACWTAPTSLSSIEQCCPVLKYFYELLLEALGRSLIPMHNAVAAVIAIYSPYICRFPHNIPRFISAFCLKRRLLFLIQKQFPARQPLESSHLERRVAESSPHLFDFVAFCILQGLLDLDDVWHVMSPAPKSLIPPLQFLKDLENGGGELEGGKTEQQSSTQKKINILEVLNDPTEFDKLRLILAFVNFNALHMAWKCIARIADEQDHLWTPELHKPLIVAIIKVIAWSASANSSDAQFAVPPCHRQMIGLHWEKGAAKSDEEDSWFSVALPLLQTIGVTLCDVAPLDLLELIRAVVTQLQKIRRRELREKIFAFIGEYILPAYTAMQPCLPLCIEMWKLLEQIPLQVRFCLYERLVTGAASNKKLAAIWESTRKEANRVAKRVTATVAAEVSPISSIFSGPAAELVGAAPTLKAPLAGTSISPTLVRLSATNPWIVAEVVIEKIGFLDGMFGAVAVDTLNDLDPVSLDVFCFAIVMGICFDADTNARQLRNLAAFAGRLLRRHGGVGATAIVKVAAEKLRSDTEAGKAGSGATVFFKELLIWLGGSPDVSTDEMNAQQLQCMGGGTVLKRFILSDTAIRAEQTRPLGLKANRALRTALSTPGLLGDLVLHLGKQMAVAAYGGTSGGTQALKKATTLYDELRDTLNKLCDFVTEAEPTELLLALSDEELPPHPPNEEWEISASNLSFWSVIDMFVEPHVVWKLRRLWKRQETQNVRGLLAVAETLTLQGLNPPISLYEETISTLMKEIQKAKLEAARPRSDVYLSATVTGAVRRLVRMHKLLKDEFITAVAKSEETKKMLMKEKDSWFTFSADSSVTMSWFIDHLIAKLCLSGEAPVAAGLLNFIVTTDAEGFDFALFVSLTVKKLLFLLRGATLDEVDSIALFINETCQLVRQHVESKLVLREPPVDVEEIEEEEIRSMEIEGCLEVIPPKRCLTTFYSLRTPQKDVAALIGLQLLAWESEIFGVLQGGLDETNSVTWIDQRAAIKFLNKTYRNFPFTWKKGRELLTSIIPAVIEGARARRWDDVVANARALLRHLRSAEPTWLERPPPEVLKKIVEEEERKEKEGKTAASDTTTVITPAPAAPAEQSVTIDKKTEPAETQQKTEIQPKPGEDKKAKEDKERKHAEKRPPDPPRIAPQPPPAVVDLEVPQKSGTKDANDDPKRTAPPKFVSKESYERQMRELKFSDSRPTKIEKKRNLSPNNRHRSFLRQDRLVTLTTDNDQQQQQAQQTRETNSRSSTPADQENVKSIPEIIPSRKSFESRSSSYDKSRQKRRRSDQLLSLLLSPQSKIQKSNEKKEDSNKIISPPPPSQTSSGTSRQPSLISRKSDAEPQPPVASTRPMDGAARKSGPRQEWDRHTKETRELRQRALAALQPRATTQEPQTSQQWSRPKSNPRSHASPTKSRSRERRNHHDWRSRRFSPFERRTRW